MKHGYVTLNFPSTGPWNHFADVDGQVILATTEKPTAQPDWDEAVVLEPGVIDNPTVLDAITTLARYVNGNLSVTLTDRQIVDRIRNVFTARSTASLDDLIDIVADVREVFADAGTPIVRPGTSPQQRADDLNLNQIVNILRTMGVTCELIPGRDDHAYIEARSRNRRVDAGSGYWITAGQAYAHRHDFQIEAVAVDLADQRDNHPPHVIHTPPSGATEADIATMIANTLAGREPLLDDGRVAAPPLLWCRDHDYDHDDQIAASAVIPPDCTSARYLIGPDGQGHWSVLLITTGIGRRGPAGHLEIGDYDSEHDARNGAQGYEDAAHKYGFPRTKAALAAKRQQQ